MSPLTGEMNTFAFGFGIKSGKFELRHNLTTFQLMLSDQLSNPNTNKNQFNSQQQTFMQNVMF